MKYVKIFETNDRYEFSKAKQLLEEHKIEFQILHEYRLHDAKNFGSQLEPALIRVMEKDKTQSIALLKDKRILKAGKNNQKDVDSPFKNKSVYSPLLFAKEIESILGCTIQSVKYFQSDEFDFDNLHSIDSGILIEIDNGMSLTWVFKEEEINIESGTYLPERYALHISKEDFDSNEFLEINNVSVHPRWSILCEEKIEAIHIYSQEIEDDLIITDIKITTKHHAVAILSIVEPIETDNEIEFDLSVGDEWMVVLFEEEDIKATKRF
ncbi:MAG: hypothetical protein P1U56_09165 [Saprospiraceae bacterium]|nr:hypothetical protein [Saprospiraceae bacterium]